MIYKDFKGIKLSALGMGTMRYPVIDGDDSRIDKVQAEQMVDYAMKAGINYYDTAYGYHGEQSELVTGELLKKYDRNSFYLATKFPGYDLGNMPKIKEIFDEQLAKCQVDYFDFYLVHNVCELNVNQYLDPQHGIYEYLVEQKEQGRIKHLGFSIHGDMDCMKKFMSKYGDAMEFCQIELNYFDYHFQDAKAKVEYLRELNIPIWVMEPVRGGQLANLSPEHADRLLKARPDETVVSWALRFLQSFPDVTVVLTGSSNMQQLMENIDTYKELKPLNKEEMDIVLDIADEMISKTAVACTSCRYCISHCPKELNIPFLLKQYNEACVAGSGDFIAPMALASLESDKQPECCISCGSCEQVCPQQLKISEHLAAFTKKLGR